MSKGPNFVERMALEVALRFGDDFESEDVRHYLQAAQKMVARAAPTPP